MVLLILFRVVVFPGSNKKFDLAAHWNSVAGVEHGVRISPDRAVTGILECRLGIRQQRRCDDLAAPGYGYDVSIALLLQRRRVFHAHLQQKIAGEAGRDFDKHLCAGRFLLHATRNNQEYASKAKPTRTLRFILSPLAFWAENSVPAPAFAEPARARRFLYQRAGMNLEFAANFANALGHARQANPAARTVFLQDFATWLETCRRP